jgi:hypothetical protein
MSEAVDPSAVLTPDNWREAARAAVETLPEEIQACVGWEPPAADRLALRVAAEPRAGAPEGQGSLVEVRWRDAVREQGVARRAEPPGRAGGVESSRADDPDWARPVVSIRSEAVRATTDLFAGRATVGRLMGEVRAAILEVMQFVRGRNHVPAPAVSETKSASPATAAPKGQG